MVNIKKLDLQFEDFKNYVLVISIIEVSIFYMIFIINTSFKIINYGTVILYSISSLILIGALLELMKLCNNIFIRNRVETIKVLNLLGIEKQKIAIKFLKEKICYLTFGVLQGLVMCILSFKLMNMFLLKLMNYDKFKNIGWDLRIIIITLVILLVVLIISEWVNYNKLKKITFIELKSYGKEKKLRKKDSIFVGCLGILLILMSYMLAWQNNVKCFFIIIEVNIVGTYMIFYSSIYIIINFLKKNKRIYYKYRNLIVISEINNKIITNAKSLSSCAVLISIAITALSFSFSFYYNRVIKYKRVGEYSFVFNDNNYNERKGINEILEKYSSYNKINFDESIEAIRFDNKYDILEFSKRRQAESYMEYISETSYKKINFNKGNLNLKKDECIIIKNQYYNTYSFFEGTYLKSSKDDTILKIKEQVNDDIINILTKYDMVVVNNETFEKVKKLGTIEKYRFVRIENEEESLKITNELNKKLKEYYPDTKRVNIYSYIKSKINRIENLGMNMFGGTIVFVTYILICTLYMILNKKYIMYNEKHKYKLLKELGIIDEEIKKIFKNQLKIIIVIPIMLATINNFFAIIMLNSIVPFSLIVPTVISLTISYIYYWLLSFLY